MFCIRAALVDTVMKLLCQVAQQSSLPHGPIPPILPASWREPICLISMRVLKISANTFIS